MVDVVEHANIPNTHRHELKGIESALNRQVYVADGVGSGSWQDLPILTTSSSFPIGTILAWPSATPPPAWSLCYGQVLNRQQYSLLFSSIGVTYGLGDGSSTFNLPDLRGRVIATRQTMGGVASNNLLTTVKSGVNGDSLGASGGLERVALDSLNYLPSLSVTTSSNGAHTHTLTNGTSIALVFGSSSSGGFDVSSVDDLGVVTGTISLAAAGSHTHTYTVNAGSQGAGHNNVQPTMVMNYIIYHGVAGG